MSLQVILIQSRVKGQGSIYPSGILNLLEGKQVIYTTEASNGYEISDIIIDGESKGALTPYTFTNVNANHTIEVSFQEKTGFNNNQNSQSSGGGCVYNKNAIFAQSIDFNLILILFGFFSVISRRIYKARPKKK